MTTTVETNDFGFEERSPLSMAHDSLACVKRLQERVSRRTAVLQEILQRVGNQTGRAIGLGNRDTALRSLSPIAEKRQLLPIVEWLKNKLLQEQLKRTTAAKLQELFCKAADEAAVMAFGTDFPLLVLPVLMQERFQEVTKANGR